MFSGKSSIKFIVFSGIDNAGKSTQIEILIKHLKGVEVKPIYLWSRGGYVGPFNFVKTVLRRILGKKIIPGGRTEQRARALARPGIRRLWLMLAIIDLLFVYGIYIRFLKIAGRTVVADRYLADTWIDFKLNFPTVPFDQWCSWRLLEKISPRPDRLFLLWLPVDESVRRGRLKKEPFPDSPDVLQKRLMFYETFAAKNGWMTIDCRLPIDTIAQKISQSLNKTYGHRVQ